MNPRERLAAVEAELRGIHDAAGDNQLDETQQTSWDALTAERAQLQDTIRRDDERRAQVAGFAARSVGTESGDGAQRHEAPAQTRDQGSPFDVLDQVRTMRPTEARRALIDANLRANADKMVDRSAEDQKHFESILNRHASDTRWASNILARSRPEYESAWGKLMTGNPHLLSEEERAAVAVGTTTQGGFLVPAHLDPSLMLTNAGSDNILRQVARKVTLTEGSVWKGVTSAGVTASWDAELTEVSDDSPAFAQPSITAFKAQAFVQASIEATEDISGLASDILMLFADAKDRLEGTAFMTGTGTSEPLGLFAAINASATLKTTSTTAATIGEVDIHALYRALPRRWRGRGSFVANPLYTLAIKRLGTAVSSSFSGDLTQPVSDRILGRPSVESDDAPTTQTTTVLDQEVIFADLSQFVIVDKPGGLSVEYIPHLFNTTSNLPDGRRGWYAYWRTGSGFPNLVAGRILVDKTSA